MTGLLLGMATLMYLLVGKLLELVAAGHRLVVVDSLIILLLQASLLIGLIGGSRLQGLLE